MSKSANKRNRIFARAEPLDENLVNELGDVQGSGQVTKPQTCDLLVNHLQLGKTRSEKNLGFQWTCCQFLSY